MLTVSRFRTLNYGELVERLNRSTDTPFQIPTRRLQIENYVLCSTRPSGDTGYSGSYPITYRDEHATLGKGPQRERRHFLKDHVEVPRVVERRRRVSFVPILYHACSVGVPDVDVRPDHDQGSSAAKPPEDVLCSSIAESMDPR